MPIVKDVDEFSQYENVEKKMKINNTVKNMFNLESSYLCKNL